MTKVIGEIFVVNGMCTLRDVMMTLVPIEGHGQGRQWNNCCEWNMYIYWPTDDLGANRRSRPRSLVKLLLWMECVHSVTYWWPWCQLKIKSKVIGEIIVVNGMCTFRDLHDDLAANQRSRPRSLVKCLLWMECVHLLTYWWPWCQSKVKF